MLPQGHTHNYCKSCQADYARERYQGNPAVREQQKAYAKKTGKSFKPYYDKYKESLLVANRNWYKENRLWACASASKRRALLRQAQGSFTVEDLQRIFDSQDWKCAYCEKLCLLTIDHIVPLSRGGSNAPENLQGLCKSCNSAKKDKTMEEFLGRAA